MIVKVRTLKKILTTQMVEQFVVYNILFYVVEHKGGYVAIHAETGLSVKKLVYVDIKQCQKEATELLETIGKSKVITNVETNKINYGIINNIV